jgi:hypothetical protein
MEISLVAYVDNAIASILNFRPKDLSGTLILHTILGKDHFISVSGEYRESFLLISDQIFRGSTQSSGQNTLALPINYRTLIASEAQSGGWSPLVTFSLKLARQMRQPR